MFAAQHAMIVATGHRDFRNQINNAFFFPALFRSVIDRAALFAQLACHVVQILHDRLLTLITSRTEFAECIE
ncbi:MAG: hypothetical protein ACI9VS_000092 [Candidatus Binatia bacterium]|jgi:hypothetical protein